MKNRLFNLWAALLVWTYTSASVWAHILRCEIGAAGDISTKYGNVGTITLTLTSLGSSTTRVAGRASTAVVKSDPEVDHLVSGSITAHASNALTSGTQFDIWVYAQLDEVPTYPNSITGTDADKTFNSENERNTALRFAHSIAVDTTAGRQYFVAPFSVASLFGGVMPKRYGLFVAHNTGQIPSASSFKYTPIYHNVSQT
jgi:hypothetical protein